MQMLITIKDFGGIFMKRKLAYGLMLLAIISSVICVGRMSGTEVQAEGTEYTLDTTTYEDYALATYTGSVAKTYIGTSAPNVSLEDYLFAGWFTDTKCSLENGVKTKASVDDNATYYAKFVPEDVLSVKVQVSTIDVNPDESVDARNIRFVSSVDSLNYSRVGFSLNFVDADGNIIDTKTNTSKDVFKRIASATAGDEYNFAPKVIDTKSEHLITATWKGDDNSGVDVTSKTGFHVKAYWKTLDGITVYGQSRYVTVSQGLTANSDIINMSIKKGTLNKGDSVTVTCGDSTVTPVNGSVIYTDDTYAHITFSLGDKKRNELSSATTFTINGSTEVYRNFYREATLGTADITWWNNTDTEFVIASAADLYGLAQRVNDKKDYFGNATTGVKKTIYLVRDITINSGIIVSNNTLVADTTKMTPWIPIASESGTYFRGVFDGQGCTISGIYMSAEAANTGLFSHTTAITEIRNIKLDNSYFGSTADYVGSIVGKVVGGTFDSIYCGNDVLVTNTAGTIGGIIGGVNQNGATISVNNCWFAGAVKVDASTSERVYCGGVLGRLMQGKVIFSNCLNTGSVTCVNSVTSYSTQFAVGGICGGTQNATSYLNMSNCFNSGSITASTTTNSSYTNGVRGLLGYGVATLTDNMARWTFENCYVESDACPQGTYQVNNTDDAYLKTTNVGSVSKTSGLISNYQSYDSSLKNLGLYANCKSDTYTEESRPYWVVNAEGMPTLKDFTTDWIDVGWYYENNPTDDEADTFTISTAEEFYGFSEISQDFNFAKDTIQLGDNIDVNSSVVSVCAIASQNNSAGIRRWTPVCNKLAEEVTDNKVNGFAGTFDGNNKTIKGMYVNTTNTNGGLFAKTVHGSIVKNFRFVDSYIYVNNASAEAGSVAGYAAGTFENIYSNAVVTSTQNRAGGIVGRFQDGTLGTSTSYTIVDANTGWIKQCWFDGSVTVSDSSACVGGIVAGVLNGKVEIGNCLNTGKVASGKYAAGLCGRGTNNAYLVIIDSVGAGGAGAITGDGTNIGSIVAGVTGKGGLELTRVFGTDESCTKRLANISCAKTGAETLIFENDITINRNNSIWAVNINRDESVETINLGTCGR